MASNHGVVYLGPGKVEVQCIDYPELKTPQGEENRPRRHQQADHDQHLRKRSAHGLRAHFSLFKT